MHNLFARLVFVLLPFLSFGQLSSSSPYSSYGLGNQNGTSDPVSMSLGRSGVAYADSSMVNYQNAASYWQITAGFPLFSVGLNNEYTTLTDGTITDSKNIISIDHFVLAFPFAKRFGLAMGLTPFAKRGYSFISSQAIGSDTLLYTYSGSGNISKVFVGLSAGIITKPNFQWSVGTNLGHLFGQTTNQRISQTEGSNSGGISLVSERLRAFHYDMSTKFDWKLNANNAFSLSVGMEPSQNLATQFVNELYYSSNVNSPSIYQTLDSTSYKGGIITGNDLNLGLNYSKNFRRTTAKNKEFISQLSLIASFRSIDYSNMTFNRSESTSTKEYKHGYQHTSFGIQYTPNIDFYNNVLGVSVFNRIKYRVGVYSTQLPYSINSSQYSQFGTTFGFGIPIVAQFSLSSVNLGFDLGKRSNGQSGSLTENYAGVSLGVVLSPSRADRWFRKVKLD
jgi:hypothetical protein